MPTTTKTYTPLAGLTGVQISKCTHMLENHMRCWRAGDFIVTAVTSYPADGDTPAHAETITYLKCRGHARMEKDSDDKAAADEARLVADEATVAAETPAIAPTTTTTTKK
jgi:hypothetical protein